MLRVVDDIIGFTEAGYKAVQMNDILNFNSAETGLQFGASKCKTVFLENIKNSFLTVTCLMITGQ